MNTKEEELRTVERAHERERVRRLSQTREGRVTLWSEMIASVDRMIADLADTIRVVRACTREGRATWTN